MYYLAQSGHVFLNVGSSRVDHGRGSLKGVYNFVYLAHLCLTFFSIAFVLSLATLLTSASHRPDSLRGLSRWALAFVINGPNAGFWKKRRKDPSAPPTPGISVTPAVDGIDDVVLRDGLDGEVDSSKLSVA